MFHTCEKVDGMTLSSVLSDVGVNEVDDIRSDSNTKDCWKNNILVGFLDDGFSFFNVRVVDVNELSMNHGNKYSIKY